MRRHRPVRPVSRQSGAALLLLVVMLGVGSAALLLHLFGGEHGEGARERQTQAMLGEAREALLGYAMTHGRLPRPAVSALDGTENPAACATAEDCNGFLPWVALGIGGSDGWGKRLRYSVTPAYTRAPVLQQYSVADKVVVSRDGQGRPFFRIGQAHCSTAAQCSPAVIFSSGKSNPATSVQGIAQLNPSLTNVDEQHNYADINAFVSRPPARDPALPGGEFDDLVVWLPLQTLYARMNIAGVLP
ncbi:hypothetical protein RugamoR57_54310 [Duganella caerulea]|uniref:hypothetical protein n=1 Tax=Duganella caerulea TaxID=2885762 RepID=UPI0030E9B22A